MPFVVECLTGCALLPCRCAVSSVFDTLRARSRGAFCFWVAFPLTWLSFCGFYLPFFGTFAFDSIKYIAFIFSYDLGHNKAVFLF